MNLSSRSSLHIAAALAAAFLAGCSAGSASAPSITTQPASTTVVSGAGATFTVAATGNGTLAYQWRKDGSPISGSNAASLALTAVTSADAGVYDCIVVNTFEGALNAGVSSGAVLAVNTAPVIVVQPAAWSTAPGGTVIFTVAASGNGTLGYQWKKDGVDILGATQASYTVASATAADAGNYSCAVTNTLGGTSTSTATAAAALTVTAGRANAPVISTQPAALTVANGDSAFFTIAATGNGTVTYQWRKDGVVLAGATDATLSIAAVTPVDAGAYDCIATNTLGGVSSSAVSDGAVLVVNGAPALLAQPTNQAAAIGGSATFTVVASGNGALTYQWRKDGVAISGATSSSYTIASVAAGSTGSYDCVITNTIGTTVTSATSAAGTLTIASSPLIADQSGTQTVAEAGTASFTVTASGAGTLGYQWYKAGTALADGGRISGATTHALTISAATLTDVANYTCIVTDKQGAVTTAATSNAAALVVVATPAISTHPAAITLAQGGTGSLSVSATSANGTLTDQWRKGGTNVSGATASTLALTNVASADAGSYDGVVTNTINGVATSVTSNPAALTVNTSVTITTQPLGFKDVEGATGTLTVAATGAGTLSYQWKKAGVAISGATNASLVFASLTGADAASYTCAVTSTLDGTITTIDSNVAVIAVNTIPVITTAPVAQNVTTGQSGTFTVVATGAPGSTLTYEWRKNGDTAPGASTDATYVTSSVTIASLATWDGSTFDCVITSTLGTLVTTTTVTTTPVALNVAVVPTATIGSSAGVSPNNFAGSEPSPTLTATVTNTASLNGTVSYQWKKGTAQLPIIGATSATFTFPGNVSVADAGVYTCTVTNTHNGASASVTVTPAITVNVFSAPVITADVPAVKYQGVNSPATTGTTSLAVTAATLGGGPVTFLWQISTDSGVTWNTAAGTGFNAATFSQAPVSSTVVNQFRCIITATLAGSTASVTSAVSTPVLFQNAQIQTSPANTNVVAGNAAPLTVVPVAITLTNTVQTFQWFRNVTNNTTGGVAVPGATSATLNFPAVAGTDGGYYYCTVTNSVPGTIATSAVNSSVVRLGVNTKPTIVTQPSPAPIATEGTSTAAVGTLSVVATSSPASTLTYQWRLGGVAIPGATASSYTIASPVITDAGTYDCVITSTLNALAPAAANTQTVTTTPAVLTVNLKPTVTAPVVTGDATTGPLTLTVTATNNNTGGLLTYAWKRNGVAVPNAIQASYTIDQITSGTAGNYTCDVSSVYVATGLSNASTATTTTSMVTVGGFGTGLVQPVITMAPVYSAGKTGIVITTQSQPGVTYEWTMTNNSGAINTAAGQGTNKITITAGANTALPMTATVVVGNATGSLVANASATLVAAVSPPRILAPATVHPGDVWMNASVDSQPNLLWTLTGQGTVTGSAPLNTTTLPFSANAGAVNGDSITLGASVLNAAGDSASSTKTVPVSTGTWITKDGSVPFMLGAGSTIQGTAAAVLPNGRVLVCGGQTMSTAGQNGAAIFDPATGRWTRAANMLTARQSHTATTLANGSVLVVGGSNPSGPLNTAEIYDPATDTWTAVVSTAVFPRIGHTATLITAGANINRVAIIGGQASSGEYTGHIALFQSTGPSTGAFSTVTVALSLPRYKHTATALNDGRILVVGGTGFTNETYVQAELVDVTSSTAANHTVSRVGSLTVNPRSLHTATLLLDGKVLIAGNAQTSGFNTAELFDPATGTFTATTGLMKGGDLAANTSGRNSHNAVRLTDGRVLLAGGTSGGTTQGIGQSAEIYVPATQTFTSTVSMNIGHAFHAMVALPNSRAMVLGGSTPGSSFTSTTEIFDAAGPGSWTTVGAMPLTRTAFTATKLADGRVLVTGGQGLVDGNVGGVSGGAALRILSSCLIYNPATGVWTSAPSLATARVNHTATLLSDGRVLVAGGNAAATSTTLASTEIFDPQANSGAGAWMSAGNLQAGRTQHATIALPDGRVLAMGGSVNGGFVSSSELWTAFPLPTPQEPPLPPPNPAGSWAFTSNGGNQTSMSENKISFTAVLVGDKVVVAGGNSANSSTPTAVVEVFNPADQSWTSQTTPLSVPRQGHATFAVGADKFVVIGGRILQNGEFGPSTPTAGNQANFPTPIPFALEVYSLSAAQGKGATLPTNNPYFKTEGRTGFASFQLPNGKVMIVGGLGTLNSGGPSPTSEIYDPEKDTLTPGTLPTGQGAGVAGVTLVNGDLLLIGGGFSDGITQTYRPAP